MFSSVFSQILGNNHGAAEEDEVKEAASAHERVYSQGAEGGHSSRDMGTAAAMQAFKMFSGGGGSKGGDSNELIGLAMGEAMKLFKSQGGASGGANQGEMLQQAATMAMKLFLTQKQGESGGGGGALGLLSALGGSGGGGGAASLISKLLQTAQHRFSYSGFGTLFVTFVFSLLLVC